MKNSNREIKFRAWDKKQKKMFNNVSTGTISIWDDNNEAKSIDCEFMQFTGLLDKNGVEIYEGDIIKSIYKNHVTGEIKFGLYEDDGILDDLYTKHRHGFYVETKQNRKDSLIGVNKETWFEVIGNRTDNPTALIETSSE